MKRNRNYSIPRHMMGKKPLRPYDTPHKQPAAPAPIKAQRKAK